MEIFLSIPRVPFALYVVVVLALNSILKDCIVEGKFIYRMPISKTYQKLKNPIYRLQENLTGYSIYKHELKYDNYRGILNFLIPLASLVGKYGYVYVGSQKISSFTEIESINDLGVLYEKYAAIEAKAKAAEKAKKDKLAELNLEFKENFR